jgi:hypothetical protein
MTRNARDGRFLGGFGVRERDIDLVGFSAYTLLLRVLIWILFYTAASDSLTLLSTRYAPLIDRPA